MKSNLRSALIALVALVTLAFPAFGKTKLVAVSGITINANDHTDQGQIAGTFTLKNGGIISYDLTLSHVPNIELYVVNIGNSSLTTEEFGDTQVLTFTLNTGDVLMLFRHNHTFGGTLTQNGVVTMDVVGTIE